MIEDGRQGPCAPHLLYQIKWIITMLLGTSEEMDARPPQQRS